MKHAMTIWTKISKILMTVSIRYLTTVYMMQVACCLIPPAARTTDPKSFEDLADRSLAKIAERLRFFYKLTGGGRL